MKGMDKMNTLEMIKEVTTVETMFGDYSYGKVLGYQVNNVPVIIGINWFLIIYCFYF